VQSVAHEQHAVKVVADEFFRRGEDGRRHNRRADREISEWERLAQINRERGKLGGRPKKNPDGNPPANPGANPPGSVSETREVIFTQPAPKASQSHSQNPDPDPEPDPGPGPGVLVADSSDSRPQQRTASVSLHEEVLEIYHELLPDLPAVKVWSKKRRRVLDARIRECCMRGKPADSPGYWRSYFGQVAASDFLCGRKGDFRASIDWLLAPTNFIKVIEGNYDNRSRGNGNRDAHAR
jgi:hypothetical protein